MGPLLLLLCPLLCLGPPLIPGVRGDDEELRWSKQSLPLILDRNTEPLKTPAFAGRKEAIETRRGGGEGDGVRLCGIECQNARPPFSLAERERALGYETVYENGTRTQTEVTLSGFRFSPTSPRTPADAQARSRRKRQVYGTDGRFLISDAHFTTNYPFATAVRLSTGCSGVLVSPKHVLTAAHCVHDGKDYLDGVQKLRVGVLQLKSKRGRGGKRRGGKKRRGRKGEGDGEDGAEGGGEETNSIDEGGARGGKEGRRARRRGRRGGGETTADRGSRGVSREGRRRRRPRRQRRSTEPKKQPGFRWSRVKQTRVPKGWIHAGNASDSVAPDYDYALLELKRAVKQKHMEVGVAPTSEHLGRIHFSGYDASESLRGSGSGGEKVVYRFCSVMKESDDLMYQHCDAQQGATGAGVYVRLRGDAGNAGRKATWQRKVIGVFSGHRWVEVEGGELRDFNVAVRITPVKYAQICHWIHGDPTLCTEV